MSDAGEVLDLEMPEDAPAEAPPEIVEKPKKVTIKQMLEEVNKIWNETETTQRILVKIGARQELYEPAMVRAHILSRLSNFLVHCEAYEDDVRQAFRRTGYRR